MTDIKAEKNDPDEAPDSGEEAGSATDSPGGASKRGDRSGMQYPSYNLEEALKFVEAIRSTGGDEVLEEDLLAHLKLSRTTKSWIYKMASVREFGLVERKGQKANAKILLTDMAKRLLRPADEAELVATRTASFLTPTLYKGLFEYYRGKTVPQVKYLANVLTRAPYRLLESVSEQAAQAFLDSARYVGMLDGDVLGDGVSKKADPPPQVAPAAPASNGAETLEATGPNQMRQTCLIRKGKVEVTILIPRDLTKTDVKRINKWLEALAIEDEDEDEGTKEGAK
jgi:hypothetical protein